MKLTIAKAELNQAIQTVVKAISSRTTIPILKGIKMDAKSTGVTLTASDTDITIQSFIPMVKEEKEIVTLTQPGSIVLPGPFFAELVKKLPSSQVDFEVNETFFATIRSGSSEVQLAGLDPEEYPVLPHLEESNTFSIKGNDLKTMIKQTGFAVSTNEATPILTGVMFHLNNGMLKLTATDRHRLAYSQRNLEIDKNITIDQLVLSGKTLNELSKIVGDDEMIEIISSDTQVLFRMDGVLFYSRVLDGSYPDTSKLINQSFKTEIVINAEQLIDSIDRAYLLSKEDKSNIVKIVADGNDEIEVSSSSTELGKVTEQLQVSSYQGEPLKISFNSKYMLDALKTMDIEQIHLGFTGMMSPIIIKPFSEDHTLHLILPYRTTN